VLPCVAMCCHVLPFDLYDSFCVLQHFWVQFFICFKSPLSGVRWNFSVYYNALQRTTAHWRPHHRSVLAYSLTSHYNSLHLIATIWRGDSDRDKDVSKHNDCNTLQHTASHYNTLQLAAPHCNNLKRRLRQGYGKHIDCNTPQHTASHCNTLQLTATHCSSLQRRLRQKHSKSTAVYSRTYCVALCVVLGIPTISFSTLYTQMYVDCHILCCP